MSDRTNYWLRRTTNRRSALRGFGAASAGAAAAITFGCGDDDSSEQGSPTAAPSPASSGSAASGLATAPGTGQPAPSATAAGFLGWIPANPADPTPVASFKTGGKAVRISDRPFTFDFMGLSQASTGEAVSGVYSKLVRYSTAASMENVNNPPLLPDLAEKWEQPDASTLIFTLAPGVKFQNVAPLNGRAFTVDDLKYSFNRGATHTKSQWKHYFSLIQSIDDVGGGKVRFNFTKPYPPALQMLAYAPMAVFPKEMGDQAALTTGVGTGAWIITKATPNVEIVYQRNPDYFKKDSAGRALPYMDGYTLSFIADVATRQAMAEAGKADFCYQQSTPITMDNAEDILKRNTNLVLQKRPLVTPLFYFGGRIDRAPWKDPRVRQAVNMLVDRESTIQSIHKGQSSVGVYFPWPYITDKEPPYSSLGPSFKYDPAEAKSLLSAAGFPSGLELQLDWYESGTNESIVTLFQQSAAPGGVTIKLVKSPDVNAHGAKQRAGDFPGVIVFAKSLDFQDPQAILPYFAPGSASNWLKLDDAKFNDLAAKLGATTGDARKDVGKQMFDYLRQELPEIPLPQQHNLTWWTSRLHNWRDQANSGNTGQGNPGLENVWLAS